MTPAVTGMATTLAKDSDPVARMTKIPTMA